MLNSSTHSPYSRSMSVDPGKHYKSQTSLSTKYQQLSSRPKLRRETAHDIEDEDINTAIRRSHSDETGQSKNKLTPNMFLKQSKKHLVHQKSAPGTPLSPKRLDAIYKTPSRTPSDESSGFLNVPRTRARGSSISGELELGGSNTYLLRQFNIQGKKVIHLGDSLHYRATSSTSINSAMSR